MTTIIITGSAGLIGSTAARFFAAHGWTVVGIDGDQRRQFFGDGASTLPSRQSLATLPHYIHAGGDIRDAAMLDRVFAEYGSDVGAVIHTAAQPSHDWAATDPQTDFGINAVGTLNLLEATRKHCPAAPFVFCSTNKVYGDNPNSLTLKELPTRFTAPLMTFGINESMSVDRTTHSLFGCSKLAADVLVQEYGRYFGMNTVCFRGGCLTGPNHAGAPQHGFLSYLVRCAITGTPYQIIGYKGKQVRDNIHAADLVAAFWEFVQAPRQGEVYNIGGGPERSVSVIEAVVLVERITGRTMRTEYVETPRVGDHIWWVSDCRKVMRDYPAWRQRYSLRETVEEMVSQYATRLEKPVERKYTSIGYAEAGGVPPELFCETRIA